MACESTERSTKLGRCACLSLAAVRNEVAGILVDRAGMDSLYRFGGVGVEALPAGATQPVGDGPSAESVAESEAAGAVLSTLSVRLNRRVSVASRY
jgi:hypothetical protein